jgi:hypothetical protein
MINCIILRHGGVSIVCSGAAVGFSCHRFLTFYLDQGPHPDRECAAAVLEVVESRVAGAAAVAAGNRWAVDSDHLF